MTREGDTRRRTGRALLTVAGFVAVLCGAGGGSAVSDALEGQPTSPTGSARSGGSVVVAHYAQFPLHFEANLGQAGDPVRFLAQGLGYAVLLTPSEAVLVLSSFQTGDGKPRPGINGAHGRDEAEPPSPSLLKSTEVRLSFVGANPQPEVSGLDPLPGKVNRFTGNDPHKWRTGIPTYAKVRYRDVYPGVDVVYYGAQQRLEYDFIVAPGADPTLIRFAVTGAETIEMDPAGDLVLRSSTGALRLYRPQIYQEAGEMREEIIGGYVLLDKGQIGIDVAAYDVTRPLVIDPGLGYSTYLGTTASDAGNGIAVDGAGNAYVTGTTTGLAGNSGADIVVAKLNAAGSTVVYLTFIAGSSDDVGTGIAVDGAGNAYVTGYTKSSNFPTLNAPQPSFGGVSDAFVVKLNTDGSALVYSTYLGGSQDDAGYGIAVDSAGNAYVTGSTSSTNFPVANALQLTSGGGNPPSSDAFVAKFNATGSALVYSTYLGGSREDKGFGIAVDGAGSAYVTGYTYSSDFPTANTLQNSLSTFGFSDAFVAKLSPAGSTLVYSTYLGGTGDDKGYGIAVDRAGNAYVTGSASAKFPTVNAIQPTLGGDADAFVAMLNAAGSALVYSTYLGGSGFDAGTGIALDGGGDAYVTGYTYSPNFPTLNAPQSTFGGWVDAFVAKIGGGGCTLVYSTYLGGQSEDQGRGIAGDIAGNAYVTGYTGSDNFPTVNAVQPRLAGGSDGFVTKINRTDPTPSTTSILASSPNPSAYGQPVTLTATVCSAGGPPSGTVTFQEGATTLGTSALNGMRQATLTTATLSVGSHAVTATYSGDTAFAGSTSTSLTHMVNETVVNAFSFPGAGGAKTAARGRDGNLWFARPQENKIGRIAPNGLITEFAVPTAGGYPSAIAEGPDGNVWFTEPGGNKIGRTTLAGGMAEFTIPSSFAGPGSIVVGSDGNLWFNEPGVNKIARITPAGSINEFVIPTSGYSPLGFASGADGNVWFAEEGSNKIGRITPAGVITEFSMPSLGSSPSALTPGPDGNIWFVEGTGNKIGRITPAGVMTEFPVPTPASVPSQIVEGRDGNLWFTERGANKIGRITPAGVITEFPIPTPASSATQIVAARDGNLWFTESFANKIARMTYGGAITEFAAPTDYVDQLLTGADGNLWYLGWGTNVIYRVASAGFNAPSLVAAVLPGSRSVQVGTPASFFATMINAGAAAATGCAPDARLVTMPATFSYQTTDPVTNAFTGTPNTPVTIPAGQSQSFVFAFTPTGPFAPQDLRLNFTCDGVGSARNSVGVNTVLLSGSAGSVPDIIALGATTTRDGILHIPGPTGAAAFAVATANVGTAASITFSADTGGAVLPLTIAVCQTNPATGTCITPVGTSVTAGIAAHDTPTFAIFVTANGTIAADYLSNRIIGRFNDATGATRGSTSVAVTTE